MTLGLCPTRSPIPPEQELRPWTMDVRAVFWPTWRPSVRLQVKSLGPPDLPSGNRTPRRSKKDDTGSRTQTSGTINVMSRPVREIAVTSDQALVVLHLNFKGAANDHGGLAGRMPVKRRHNLEQTWQESRMVLYRGRPESALSCVRKDPGRALYPKCAQGRPAASGAAV